MFRVRTAVEVRLLLVEKTSRRMHRAEVCKAAGIGQTAQRFFDQNKWGRTRRYKGIRY